MMVCPCCGSEDIAGLSRMAVICWTCAARFRLINDTVEMIDCRCGRHDNGRIIKKEVAGL